MNKLFEALTEKYPGAVVKDVKFTVNRRLVADQDVDEIDEGLARAVREGFLVPWLDEAIHPTTLVVHERMRMHDAVPCDDTDHPWSNAGEWIRARDAGEHVFFMCRTEAGALRIESIRTDDPIWDEER